MTGGNGTCTEFNNCPKRDFIQLQSVFYMSIQAFSRVIVASAIAGAMLCGCDRAGPSVDSTLDSALGTGAGEQTARLLGNRGRIEVIASAASCQNPYFVSELKVFQKIVGKAGIRIASIEKFQLTPLERMQFGRMVPREVLLKSIENQTGIDAVVLFCGFPDLANQDYDALKHSGTKIVIISAYQTNFPTLLKAGVIDMAIVPKSDQPAVRSKKADSSRELFSSEYLILTPDSVSDLTEVHN